ncbi:uncharacterized protein LOC117288932 [Asterias rubens]|uniref:uncharacterized protein LOC117288932 n=1 Tax=Asterias rubens TaxID=7604 RepID=UPI0014552122|nr:uncharacterized protein LOC117288932 [Asterias rubens]
MVRAHEGDADADDVSPGELADDESDDVDEKDREDAEEIRKDIPPVVKKEILDDERQRGSCDRSSSSAATSPRSPRHGPLASPVHSLPVPSLPFPSTNGPMTMLSKMCTALSGTDSDSEDEDSELEAMLRFNQLGMFASGNRPTFPEQEEALDLRVSKVKHRKESPGHKSNGRSKARSDSSDTSPGKSVKTVFCETVPRDVLASVSRLQADYSVLPSQVSLCRGINGRCNFVLCTDCYQAFPNVGMLSLHLIATGHNSTKQLNSELMLQRGYLALIPPRTEFFSTCALRRKQRLPAASSRKELCAYTCATCSVSFPDFLDYTVHLTTSGHDKQEKPHSSQSKPPAGDCPEEIPVNQVLKCMICQASFRTLKDLTMHMVRTKHYSHVPGHTGILLTRANAKQDEKGIDDAEEDGDILEDEECPMPANSLVERLPANVLSQETEKLSRREQRNSQSSVSSKEEMCQTATKAALNQLLAARSHSAQKSPQALERPHSVDSEINQRTSSKSRSLKCLGCYHLFANVHKLTEHMKETGHFLAPAFGHNTLHNEASSERKAPTNGTSVPMKASSPTKKQHMSGGEKEDSSQQPGDKIKIVLKDGASKKQLLSVSQNLDSESRKAAVRSDRPDDGEDNKSKSQKKLQKATSAESIGDAVWKDSLRESPVSNEPQKRTDKTPSPHGSPPSSAIKYVSPDNFDEIFPTNMTNLSCLKPRSSESSVTNPLDKLTSMVETAKETNFHPRLLSNNHYRVPWMPLVETPQHQYVNGGGMFPSYAGLAMVYNAVSQATSPSDVIASKMEKHLKAKESENVTVAEAIDKILSHSFRKDDKSPESRHSPKLDQATGGQRHGQPTGLKSNLMETCPSNKSRVHSRKSSRHARSEHLKRSTDNKESQIEHQSHRKIAKRRHSLASESVKNSHSRDLVAQTKFSSKNTLSLKSFRADVQFADQNTHSENEPQATASSLSNNKKQLVRATTVSIPVQKYVQKKCPASFKKSSHSSSESGRKEKNRTETYREMRNTRNSFKRSEHHKRHSFNKHVVEEGMRSGLQNHKNNSQNRSRNMNALDLNGSPLVPAKVHNSVSNKQNHDKITTTPEKQNGGSDRQAKTRDLTSSTGASCSSHNDGVNDLSQRDKVKVKTETCPNLFSKEKPNAPADIPEDVKPFIFDGKHRHLVTNSDSVEKTQTKIGEGHQYSAQNGDTHHDTTGDNEIITPAEGPISRLKRSLEMYKMFCDGASTSHERRPAISDRSVSKTASVKPSGRITSPSPPLLAASASGSMKIKKEPGVVEVQKCQTGEHDCRSMKSHSLPVKRTLNNNMLPCSTESKTPDSKAGSRTSGSPESLTTNSATDARRSVVLSNSDLVKYNDTALYKNSDPLHEIDKLVNSTTGIQHPPVPLKIARISVDMANRGAYVMKREPEIYVNPGIENTKTNPLEEMCKMLNSTHR